MTKIIRLPATGTGKYSGAEQVTTTLNMWKIWEDLKLLYQGPVATCGQCIHLAFAVQAGRRKEVD